MVIGTVTWFNNDKGYGFLRTPDGDDVFVHHTAIQSTGYRTLNEGESVQFDVKAGPKGSQAENVKRVTGEDQSPVDQPAVEALAIAFVDGLVRLMTVTPDGSVQYVDPCKHLHGLLYVSGAETIAFKQAIEEFEELLNSATTTERDLQAFFERNPEFIMRDEHRAARPHVVLERDGTQGPLIPDFVLEPVEQEGLADLLELKHPGAKLFILRENRVRYSASLLEACAQLREYSHFFETQANRERVREKYGLLAYRPRMFVIIGRRGSVDPIMARRAATDIAQPLVVDTYDDILDRALHALKKMTGASRR